jgi:serine/threonine-protein kinase
MAADGNAKPLIVTPAFEQNGKVSPNGNWIAFNSSETGRRELYVRPFPNVNEAKWTVSAAAGGHSAIWARDGRELFYMNGATLMSVAIDDHSGSFVAGVPMALFSGPFDTTQDNNYDVFPDGQHFVMVEADPDARPTRLQVVLNWAEELKRREEASTSGR